MNISIQSQQVIIQPAPARAIHPAIAMSNPAFLQGYLSGLNGALHPELMQERPLTDDDLVDSVLQIASDYTDGQSGDYGDREALYYSVGSLLGLIVGKCH